MNHLISFRCYYDKNFTQHYQEMPLKDIPKWLQAYQFTHPQCRAITIAVDFKADQERSESKCMKMSNV